MYVMYVISFIPSSSELIDDMSDPYFTAQIPVYISSIASPKNKYTTSHLLILSSIS